MKHRIRQRVINEYGLPNGTTSCVTFLPYEFDGYHAQDVEIVGHVAE